MWGWRRRSVGYLLDRLRRLRADGHFRQDLEVPDMSVLVQGVLLTFAMQASLGRARSREEVGRRADHAWRTLLKVLSP